MEENQGPGNVSRDEQIGFHKGALKTLAAERQELSKILQIVEQLMHMHINGLKELGVDLAAEANAQAGSQAGSSGNSGDALDNLVNK
ncbi:hypothetical protein C0585_05350 [Candidatus Woesearchaeota archaeon]|nr:MAG: hypothetical protein C0585_05350 [Candidatus Woesearchaeota archaeon]